MIVLKLEYEAVTSYSCYFAFRVGKVGWVKMGEKRRSNQNV
jgi:hypothetical protein